MFHSLHFKSTVNVYVLAIFFESAVVEVSALHGSPQVLLRVEALARKAGVGHVSRLVGGQKPRQSTGRVLDGSVVEWLRLVELFAVLSSHLIGVQIILSVPAG